jgi:AmpD protein
MNLIDHWIDGVARVPSPNFGARPDAGDISLIVLHCISLPPGEFGSSAINELFTNTLDPAAHPYYAGLGHLRVSAHLLIRRSGEIVQYVRFVDCAFHAGLSSFRGRPRCNDFSIGIELEGTDDRPYEDAQYGSLLPVLAALLRTYPGLSRDRIVGHSDITPERKTDPGPWFDWSRLRLSERSG